MAKILEIQLVTANVVLAARHFNPSILNQVWLVDREIVRGDEFRPGSVFTDMMVNAVAAEFALFVSPDQLQFVPTVPQEKRRELIVSRLGRLVETIPHTPYSACGLNFIWHVSVDDIAQLSRELFFVPESTVHQEFDTEDARFGGYLSKCMYEGRLKLDIKPITIKDQETGEELDRLQFSFNMHRDLDKGKDVAAQIGQLLERWNDVHDETAKIVHSNESATL